MQEGLGFPDNFMSLFGYSRYPNQAGFKEQTTSKYAAEQIEQSGRAALLRERCLTALEQPMTADEVASLLDESILSVRPRISELSKRNLIKPTGERRANESGVKAKVWVMV